MLRVLKQRAISEGGIDFDNVPTSAMIVHIS